MGSVGTMLGGFRSPGVGYWDSQRELAGAENIAGAVAIASVVNIKTSIIYYNCYA